MWQAVLLAGGGLKKLQMSMMGRSRKQAHWEEQVKELENKCNGKIDLPDPPTPTNAANSNKHDSDSADAF